MIEAAGKYSSVKRESARGQAQSKTLREEGSSHQSKTLARGNAAPRPLFTPTLRGARDVLQRWFWREIKEGGFLDRYLRSEKARVPAMVRRIGRFMAGFQQNNKSDFRRLAAIPARVYHRWKAEDEHFFEDDENLRSLRRDNPEMAVYVGRRALPNGRFRKVYRTDPPSSDYGATSGTKS